MKIRHYIICAAIVLTGISGCSTAAVKKDTNLKTADEDNILHLLNLINKYSNNSQKSYTLKVNIDGHSGAQKFKTGGNIEYNNNPRRMKIVFHDAILQSPITEIVQEDDILKFYFPLDKTVYIENINKIDLKSYTNFYLDFNLISDLLSGKIPLIKQYRIYKGLANETDPVISGTKLIILENNDYYETISFLNDVPDKILWVNKTTKEKIEVYFKKPFIKENFLFYKETKIISRNADLNIVIQFSSIKPDAPVDPENLTKIKISKDAKIIKRD
jgi:hypothetical protein